MSGDYRFTMATDGKAGEWVYVGSDTGKLRRCVQTSDPHRVPHYQLGQDVVEGDTLTLNVNTGLLFTEEESRKQAAASYAIPQRFLVGGVPPEYGTVTLDPKAMLTTPPEEDQPMTAAYEDWQRPAEDGGAPILVSFCPDDDGRVPLHAETYRETLRLAGFERTDTQPYAGAADWPGDGDITYRYDRNTDTDYPMSFPVGTPVYTGDGKVFGHLGEPLDINEDETSEDYGIVTQRFVLADKPWVSEEKWGAAVSDVITTEPSAEVTEVWCRATNSTLEDRAFSYHPDDPSDAAWYAFAADLLSEAGYRRVWPVD